MAVVGFAATMLALPLGAVAGPGGGNSTDVWVETVGVANGPGHTNDPHLGCGDIALWGDALANPTGTYTIEGIAPSGSGLQDYPTSGMATWTYNTATGGPQTIDVISLSTLIGNAVAHGDTPTSQGFHFDLELNQNPVKHKVFWVDCTLPGPAPANCYATKDVTPTGAQPAGTTLNYTVTATNNGGLAGPCTISDVLTGAGGATFAVVTPPSNATASAGSVTGSFPHWTWTITSLGSGQGATLTMSVKALTAGTVTNTALVTNGCVASPNQACRASVSNAISAVSTPTPTPTPTPSSTPTPTPTPSASPSASPSAGVLGSTVNTPSTGAPKPMWPVLYAGIAMTALGLLLRKVGKRR